MRRALLFSCVFASGMACLVTPAAAQPRPAECPPPVVAATPTGTTEQALTFSHRFATGKGVRVAIIDTGIAPHPRLPHVHAGADLVGEGPKEGARIDCDGHGTIVAGIIAAQPAPTGGDPMIGIAPDVEIVSIRQSSSILRSPSAPDSTAGTIATLADAIHRALDLKTHLINVSLASCVPRELLPQLDTSVLDSALSRAERDNVVVIAAAGNLSSQCSADSVAFPAFSNTVLAVSAAEDTHALADYSLRAPHQQLSAPGTVPVGLSPTGSGFASAMGGDAGERPFSGTSFAAPRITGIAALLKQRYPQDSAQQLRSRILAAASPGTGHVDPDRALMQLGGSGSTRVATIASPVASSLKLPLRSLKVALLLIAASALLSCGMLWWRRG